MADPLRRVFFRAYRPDGEVESGHVDARDAQDAVRQLRSAGKVPFELSVGAVAGGPSDAPAPRPSRQRGSLGGLVGGRLDPARLFGDLAVMLGAGFTVDVALRAVAEAETDAGQARAANAIHARISEGRSVAEAFAGVPDMPAGVPALLASGESSGRLDTVVASLAASFARTAERRRQVTEALLYPAFLVVVMIGAFLLLALFLAPALEPVFANAGVEPPLLVRWLTGFGTFVTGQWTLVLLVALLALLAALLAVRSDRARRWLSEAALRVPGLGRLRRRSAAGRYLETMALLLGNGVPILDAMRLGADAAAAASGRSALLAARQSVADGGGFWQALAESRQFPEFVISLVRLGEQSNNLAPMLARAAAVVEQQQQQQVSRLLTFLTPAITLLLGGVVGGLVVSVMTTLLSINEIALR